jgi:hypothetical protein
MANPTPPSNTPTVANDFQQPPTLTQIQQKIRRLTRSPSEAQLTTADLNNYINTSVLYDFPEHLRTFNLRTTFTFYTNPGQDVYNTDIASFAGATNNPLYNFQNKYISVHQPYYIGGYSSFFSQSQEQFYAIYPKVTNIASPGLTGNGTAGPFTGVINSSQAITTPGIVQNISLLQNQVLFNAIGTPGTGEEIGLALVDVPVVDPTTGVKLNIGNLFDPNSAAYAAALANPPTVVNTNNFINYLTGFFTINFSMATVAGTKINSMSVPQILTIPQAILYYSNQFVLRPVPDQVYAVNFEVYQRPTALLAENQVPELEEYWQYIAYLAAKKIFEDRMDMDSVQMIMPELKKQEALCARRTLVQYTNERTATIYTEQTSYGGQGGWGWGQSNGL